MSGIDSLLGCLDRVRKTGPDRWQACCPAHDDRGPSLSLRLTDDGRVLVHCFAGCSAHEVVSAVGMSLSDLFPPREIGHHARPIRQPFSAGEALNALGQEVAVVALASRMLAAQQALNGADHERLILAGERLSAAASYVSGGRR